MPYDLMTGTWLCKKCNGLIPNDRDSTFCSDECSKGQYDGTTLITDEFEEKK